MSIVYNAQTNIIAVLTMAIVLIQIIRRSFKKDSSSITFRLLIYTEFFICLFDFLSVYLNGTTFKTSRLFLQIANISYFGFTALSSYIWALYVNYRVENKKADFKTIRLIAAIPLILFYILLITNPFTNLVFSIDENNFYHRERFIFLHWIVSYSYLVAASVKAIVSFLRKSVDKAIALPLVFYIIPPTISSILLIFFQQLSIIQIGIMFSILIIYLENQINLVLKDDLTGTNNKRALLRYQTFLLDHHEKDNITVIMFDLDKFKSINDNFGHLEGDFALKRAADIIEAASHYSLIKMGLFRYGGDEFIAVGTKIQEQIIHDFLNELENQLNIFNASGTKEYKLSISSGYASAKCHSQSDFQNLINKADENMYTNKEQKKKAQQ